MFTGKTVVITGAGAGIGKELTLRLASRGAEVWAIDVNAKALDEVVLEARKFGHVVVPRVCDVTSLEAMTAVRDDALKRGEPIAYWINNAGIAGIADFLATPLDQFFKVIDVNLKGVVIGTRVALETMEDAGVGRIVNMASIAGHLPAPFMTAYNATKHAVVGFTRSLQAELRLKNSPVSILMVSPGFVDTGIIAKGEALGYPEWLTFMLATPKSVVDAVVKGMLADADEIYPTLNGRLMKSFYRIFPKTTVRSSKILLAKSWRDVLTNRYGA